jgi:hypothetical protein
VPASRRLPPGPSASRRAAGRRVAGRGAVRVPAVWVAALSLVTCLPGAFAQGPGRPEPQRLKEDQRRGVVVDRAPGMLAVRLPAESTTVWRVIPAGNATIEVVGPASRAMLAPRQFIRFSATLDEFGKVAEPVVKVTFPGGGTPSVMAPGLGLETGGKKVPGRRPAGLYTINGIIREVDGDTVTVLIGKERFEFTVPADAELVVQTNNLSIVDKDDTVEVDGTYFQVGQLMASEIKVTLAKPLAPPDPKARTSRR